MKVWASLAGLLAKIGAVLGLYFKGRGDARRKQKQVNSDNRITALETENEINDIGRDAVDKRLSKWMRDGK